jgi:flagellar biosynthesis protein
MAQLYQAAGHSCMDDKHDENTKSAPLTGRSDAIAVALSEDDNNKKAPRITASGRGAVADQILQLALDHDIKIREDSDLAEILSKVEVDTPIPLEAFAAVSEILSYLYKSQGNPVPEFNFNESLEDGDE